METRVSFMYDNLDYDNERFEVREKFLTEMHKKTTVQDIGEMLDEFKYSSKAAIVDYWDHSQHILEEPIAPAQDKDQDEFDW